MIFCSKWDASIFEASETASGVYSAMYSDEYIQDEVEVIIKKISKVNFESDLSEAVVKKLFFVGKSKGAPERVIQIWFPDNRPPKWAVELIEKHASNKDFESFFPPKISSLRSPPFRDQTVVIFLYGRKKS
ncbi:uncharacterized protein LOC110920910 [Helianthus annuus]|uniref:uncharacterized protein LOC110920910 n=1 Tax=Helianthus annuus TaxID=4232 RepID=UPI000B905F7B|nr:uncharacterized protein LOC110920910 [Helianthus annuus]XP_035842375.1 uncharacterized protein LOC110920910 [Helianthus annuus]